MNKILEILKRDCRYYDEESCFSITTIYRWKDIKSKIKEKVKPDPYCWAICCKEVIDGNDIYIPMEYFNDIEKVVERFVSLLKDKK